MVRKLNLKESGSAAVLDGNKVLPAMGFVDAANLIPVAKNFSTWNNYAMYIKGITILITNGEDNSSWWLWEFDCNPQTVNDLDEERLLEFGYYPEGIRAINQMVTLTDKNGRDKDVYVRCSVEIGIADLLYTILPYFK